METEFREAIPSAMVQVQQASDCQVRGQKRKKVEAGKSEDGREILDDVIN